MTVSVACLPSARRRVAWRCAGISLGSLLAVAPLSLRAAPEAQTGEVAPSTAAPASAPQESPEAIFRRGQAKYETADYNGAIELWTEAYGLLPSTPENAAIKALLIYNLAQAHVKAFELDDDAIHLKQAQQLLTSFRASLEGLYEDEAEREQEQLVVDGKLAELEARLAELEAESNSRPVPPPAVDRKMPIPPDPAQQRRQRALIISGGTLTGLGVVGGVIAITGGVMASQANDLSDVAAFDLEAREAQFARGRTGNALLIAGSVAAGVLVPTGVALLAVGLRGRARARRGLALLPRFGPEGAGLSLRGRF